MITRFSQEKLTADEIKAYFEQWEGSKEHKWVGIYKKYYEVANTGIYNRWVKGENKNKVPNNYIPSAYYKTVCDGMSGYMFNDVVYTGSDSLTTLLEDNNQDVKDMTLGTNALAYNRAIELIYTTGDGVGAPEVKFSILDPQEVALIFNTDIEPVLFCAIRKFAVPADLANDKDQDYYDVIYSDEWQYWVTGQMGLKEREEPRPLFFAENPVNYYTTQAIGFKSPFHQALVYIEALDILLSGNSDELEKVADAILAIGKILTDDQKANMAEWKVLEDMSTDERAEYITKQLSPAFRQYVSELLIQEIHKHCHVVDMYNPDTGLGGAASGKALNTRLFDMEMYSNQLEKLYRDGADRRIRILADLSTKIPQLEAIDYEGVKITFNRTKPNQFEDMLTVLNSSTMILPLETIHEKLGLDHEEQMKRFENTRPEVDVTEIEEGEAEVDVSVEAGAVDTGSGVVTLNGAQVTAAKGIIQSYSLGELSLESATNMMVIFFNLNKDQADSLFIGINPAAPNDDIEEGATGDKTDVSEEPQESEEPEEEEETGEENGEVGDTI